MTRVAAKMTRFGRRVGLLNPAKYASKSGREGFNREIRSLRGDVNLANMKAKNNIVDATNAVKSAVQLKPGESGKHVSSIIGRTPTAVLGPVIPVPGATEAIGVAGPYIEQFVPGVREGSKGITKFVKKAVDKVGKITHESRKYII